MSPPTHMFEFAEWRANMVFSLSKWGRATGQYSQIYYDVTNNNYWYTTHIWSDKLNTSVLIMCEQLFLEDHPRIKDVCYAVP